MYLQLAGPQPLDTAENPLAPGARPYSYDAFYLGQDGAALALPDDLFAPSAGGYVEALKSLSALYGQFKSGFKKQPSEVLKTGQMAAIDPVTLQLIMKAVVAGASALSTVARGVQAQAANQRITELYNQNQFNVQNLNRMTAAQIADQIAQIDSMINMTPRVQFGRQMALARFRLVYQQQFDRRTRTGLALPPWALYAGLGVAAYLLIRRK
jgi:hypothetical protein